MADQSRQSRPRPPRVCESPHTNVHSLQGAVTGSQIVFLTYCRVRIVAHRHIELALAVDTPEAVVAGLIEVDEASGDLDAVVKPMLAAYLVVVLFRVVSGVLLQLLNERFGVALNDLVGIDEIKVNIT